MGSPTLKMLIADRESLISRRIKEFLSEKGIECEIVTNGQQLMKSLFEWEPNFILIDLLFTDCSAIDLLSTIKSNPALVRRDIKVLVTSSHNSPKNVKQAFTAGACDYLVKPFKVEDVLGRIVFQLQKRPSVPEPEEKDIHDLEGAALYLHLLELIMKEAIAVRNPREKLFSLMQMLALSMKAVRCSIIRTDMEHFAGVVIASSDDIRVKKINIDLTKYPEVIHTVNTLKTTAIENLDFNPELARLKKIVKTISFNSIVVTPVFVDGEVFGVVSARMDAKAQKFNDLQVRFCQVIAHVCAMVIKSVEYFPYLEAKKSETDNAA